MPMDDPGWGEYVPVPEDDKTKKQPPARRPSGGKGGGFSIGPLSGPTLIGVAVIAVIIIVGVVLKVSSGSSHKNAGTTTTTTTATTTTPAATTTPPTTSTPKVVKPKPKPKPVVTTNPNFLPKATYIKKADAICKAYKPSLQTAGSAGNVTLFLSLLKKEVGELEKLKPPDQDSGTMNRALEDAENAIISFQQNDLTTANKYIVATDTLVGVFGMHVCNYGK